MPFLCTLLEMGLARLVGKGNMYSILHTPYFVGKGGLGRSLGTDAKISLRISPERLVSLHFYFSTLFCLTPQLSGH